VAHVGREREIAIDDRGQRQACLGRLRHLERRGDAEPELDRATVAGHRKRLCQDAIAAFGGDEQRITPLLHRDPLIGRSNLAAAAVGRLTLLAVDP